MNHGKIAYLKVIDLEKKYHSLHENSKVYDGFLELNKENIDYSFNSLNQATINFPAFNLSQNNEICFQSKILLESINNASIEVEYIVNGIVIHQETFTINEGEQEIICFKPYTPLINEECIFELRISTQTKDIDITIKSIKTIVMGVSNINKNNDVSLRAIPLKNSKTLISYIDANRLYYIIANQEKTSLSFDDFTYLGNAQCHSFSLENFNSENLNLFYVNEQNELFYSKPFTLFNEKLIDTNVSIIHSCTCPNSEDNINLITYIKAGKCYYTTIKNDNIGIIKQFSLPTGKYIDIYTVSNPNNPYMYVIATHENGSNYIIRSRYNSNANTITQSLCTDLLVSVTKYIDLSFIKPLLNEKLNINYTFSIEQILKFSECFERVSKDNINLKLNVSGSLYELSKPLTYGVYLDKSLQYGTEWASYTDDCVNMSGAYMDFNEDKFISNGWTDLWPFNQIKPCIIKDNKLVGYLNPNNYAQFEDGSASGHTSSSVGNVMVEIPKIYYHISKDEKSNFNIKISDTKKENFCCLAHTHKGVEYDKIYVSAYLAGYMSFKSAGPKSYSRARHYKPYSQTYYSNIYSSLRKFYDEQWEIMPYNTVVLLQCLFAIMFKSTNSQDSLGGGYFSDIASFYTGTNDANGMYYGKNPRISGSGSAMKLFGMEDLYTRRNTICPGIYVTSSGIVKFIDVTNPNSSYDPSKVSEYISDPNITDIISTNQYIPSDVVATNEIGFLGCNSQDYNADTDYFCGLNFATYNDSYNSFMFGYPNNTYGGIYALTNLADTSMNRTSFRLIYYPK